MFNWTCHTSTLKKVVADPCLGPKCTIAAWHSSVPWCRAIELLLHIVSSTLFIAEYSSESTRLCGVIAGYSSAPKSCTIVARHSSAPRCGAIVA